jgi:hypothetical protein
VVESVGYVHGYNPRAPGLAVLIVEPRAEQLRESVARYLSHVSFAMAAIPERVAPAIGMLAFDGIVVPDEIAGRQALIAQFGGAAAPVLEHGDPVAVARELRARALARRSRISPRP